MRGRYCCEGVLWTVAPSLVFFLLIYASIGTGLTTAVFGKRLMQLQFLQLQKEGDLRFDLVRARENSGAHLCRTLFLIDAVVTCKHAVRVQARDGRWCDQLHETWLQIMRPAEGYQHIYLHSHSQCVELIEWTLLRRVYSVLQRREARGALRFAPLSAAGGGCQNKNHMGDVSGAVDQLLPARHAAAALAADRPQIFCWGGRVWSHHPGDYSNFSHPIILMSVF